MCECVCVLLVWVGVNVCVCACVFMKCGYDNHSKQESEVIEFLYRVNRVHLIPHGQGGPSATLLLLTQHFTRHDYKIMHVWPISIQCYIRTYVHTYVFTEHTLKASIGSVLHNSSPSHNLPFSYITDFSAGESSVKWISISETATWRLVVDLTLLRVLSY